MRYFAAFIIAALVNLGLFLLMAMMVLGQPSVAKNFEPVAVVNFLRIKREPPPPPQKHPLPKKPPPPPKEPPPLKVHQPQRELTQVPTVSPVIPHIKIPLALNTTGPYLGGYRPNPGKTLALAGDLMPLVRIPPLYPPRAARRGIEGSVIVTFIITENGSVRNPQVIEAHPPGIFNQAALRAIKGWKFKAKKVDGEWVAQRATQRITFSLER